MLQDKIKTLINLIEGTEVGEIEVSSFWGAQKIRLKKSSQTEVHSILRDPVHKDNLINENEANNFTDKKIEDNNDKAIVDDSIQLDNVGTEIIAPLVGTFYKSPKPDSPPFVKIGDSIKVGQTICIIEAMKIFNEIESEISGTVVKILVEDGTPVEYGQPLIVVKVD
mgnify:CR=1 FL=1